jgi:hypothetical protein
MEIKAEKNATPFLFPFFYIPLVIIIQCIILILKIQSLPYIGEEYLVMKSLGFALPPMVGSKKMP